MSITKLTQEYDRVRALRDGLQFELALDADGAARAAKVETIAEAVRAGEPIPDLWLNRQSRALELAGVDRALELAAADLVESLQGERPSIAHVPLPVGEMDGAALAEAIEQAYAEAEQGRAANESRRDALERFRSAKETFERIRGELLREGHEPQAASDGARGRMTPAEVDALFPPGSPGELRLTGRTIGETVTA
jgi:hypothetical protein